MNALVTGGAGFIGSHIVRDLLKLQFNVIVLDDLSGGFIENVPSDAFLVEGSVVDKQLVDKLFDTYRFDYVFHCAAYAAEVLSHHIRKFNYENNVIGSINLINSSVTHDTKCFVFLSSLFVYGDNEPPFSENMVPIPLDPYGIAKLTIELDLKAARAFFGLPFIIYRLHNVYGERQNIGDRYRNVVGIFINQLLQGKPITVFGDGTQTRSFSYVGDVVPVIARSIQNVNVYNEVLNIGSDRVVSLNELASIIASVMNVHPQIQYLRPRFEVKNVWASHEKIKSLLGVIGETSLELGIKEMHEWIKQSGPRMPKYFNHIEITKMLPESWNQR